MKYFVIQNNLSDVLLDTPFISYWPLLISCRVTVLRKTMFSPILVFSHIYYSLLLLNMPRRKRSENLVMDREIHDESNV